MNQRDPHFWPSRAFIALQLFREGWDTRQIADHFHINEAAAERWVTMQRSMRLGQANPYEEQAQA